MRNLNSFFLLCFSNFFQGLWLLTSFFILLLSEKFSEQWSSLSETVWKSKSQASSFLCSYFTSLLRRLLQFLCRSVQQYSVCRLKSLFWMLCSPCLSTFPWFYTKEVEMEKKNLVKTPYLKAKAPSLTLYLFPNSRTSGAFSAPPHLRPAFTHSLKLALYWLPFTQGNDIVWNSFLSVLFTR